MKNAQADFMRTYTHDLQVASTQDELQSVFMRRATDLGFRSFAYHMVKVSGIGSFLPLAVTTYPDEWVSRYIKHDYVRIDPVIAAGPSRCLPYSWDEVVSPDELSKQQKGFFSEAHDFDLRKGLSIPIHGPDGEYAQMTLVADGTEKEGAKSIEEFRHLLHLMSMHYHFHAGNILRETGHLTIKSKLSPRERECLTWAARGKTSWEISMILSIAENTVDCYINSARQKIGAFSRAQLIVKALCEGLIDPPY